MKENTINFNAKNDINIKFFNIIELIVFFIFIFISYRIVNEREIKRFFLEFICFGFFILITELYKKKRFFDMTYVYYLVIIFINNNLSPYYYTEKKILDLYNNKYPYLKDYFYIYFVIYFIISIIIILYLLYSKKRIIKEKFEIKTTSKISLIIIGIFICFPISSILKTTEIGSTVFIPILSLFFIQQIKKESLKNWLIYIFFLIFSIYPYIFNRFKVVLFIFPLVIIYILNFIFCKKNMSYKKIILIIFFMILSLLFYGIVSEIIKLNMFYSGNFRLEIILSNNEELFLFAKKQIFRIFGIWTILSGNMISHIYNNDFFYGVSYLKGIAPYLNLPYINIPIISAKYIGAAYAQVGLIIEGFLNFNILGAVFSGIFIYFFLEILTTLFLKKRDDYSFCLMIAPFSKILLDGGSIYSALYIFIVCIFIFTLIKILNILLKVTKRSNI